MTDLSEPQGPHSRACKFKPHTHGDDCSGLCPTCHGSSFPQPRVFTRPYSPIFSTDLEDDSTREIALEQAVAAWQASYDPFSHPSPASPERITASILERAEAFLKFLRPEPNPNHPTAGENS